MKKWLLIAVVLIALLFIGAYVFLPEEVTGSNVRTFNCNINAINRYLFEESRWSKWWPGDIVHDSSSGKLVFTYKGYQYQISEKKYDALDVQTTGDDVVLDGTLFFIPAKVDTVLTEWKYSLKTSGNLVARWHLTAETKKINDNMAAIMESMKNFLDKPENVYGMRIDQVIVKDTILVTTNFSSADYPSTAAIYDHINAIRSYISAHHAAQTDAPMLHIRRDSGFYKTQVAIPVNAAITGTDAFPLKRMVPGKILVAQVTGGIAAANEGMDQLQNFVTDFGYSSPAIPFQSLVTNRIEQPDTSKWVTKVYYPIF